MQGESGQNVSGRINVAVNISKFRTKYSSTAYMCATVRFHYVLSKLSFSIANVNQDCEAPIFIREFSRKRGILSYTCWKFLDVFDPDTAGDVISL